MTAGHWRAIPFSYRKVFGGLAIVIELIWFVVFAVTWLPRIGGSGRGDVVDLVVFVLIVIIPYVLIRDIVARAVWRFAPQSFRECIPYDSGEALAGKGTIHSYADLLRWFRHRLVG